MATKLQRAKQKLAGKVFWERQRVKTPYGTGIIESFGPVSDGKTEEPGCIVHYGGSRRVPWKMKNVQALMKNKS